MLAGRRATDLRVLFFGDSLVAGAGDPMGAGWVGRVLAASFQAGVPLTAYNLGVRGETSEQIAARWRREAEPRLLKGADCRLVASFGVNDTTLENGRPRVPTERSLAALTQILDGTGALGLPCLVVGPGPVADAEHNQRIRELSTAIAGVCATRGVRFVDVIERLLASPAWTVQLEAGDGAHPAATGYAELAGLVLAGGWIDWLSTL